VRDFHLRNGVGRLYLSLNQTRLSPINNAKGLGMEGYGISQNKIDRQIASNITDRTGDIGTLGDAGSIVNSIRGALSPVLSELGADPSGQPLLILGKAPDPNLLGTSRALDFMHSSLRGPRSNSVFRAYLKNTEDDEGNVSPNALTNITTRLNKHENMAVGSLPQTTLINGEDLINDFSLTQVRDTDNLPRAARGLRNAINNSRDKVKNNKAFKKASKAVETINAARSGIFGTKNREALESGTASVYNETTQIEQHGDLFRISPETVKIIEDALESEYVPFYFQDLRTNEILSFHAFLTQAEYQAQPDWSEAKYVGRPDVVPTYRGHTTESVSVAFSVFATSPEDFGILYEKINRFLGFLFPQYDKGIPYDASIGAKDREGQFTGNAFKFTDGTTGQAVIPFSQKQIASPIIRMRIGDIIMSPSYDDNLSDKPKISRRHERFHGIRDIADIVRSDGETSAITELQDQFVQAQRSIGNVNNSVRNNLAQRGINSINNIPVDELDFVDETGVLTIPAQFGDDEHIYGVTRGFGDDEEALEASTGASAQASFLEVLSEIDAVVNETVATTNTNLTRISNELRELVGTAVSINRGNAAIRKSFESIGGKGVAGYINSSVNLKLIDDGFPWEIQPGLRAPMGYNVSFTFTILREVSPGLDHRGEMRPVFAPKIGRRTLVEGEPFDNTVPEFLNHDQITGNSNIAQRAFTPPQPTRAPRQRATRRRVGSMYGVVVDSNVSNAAVQNFGSNSDTIIVFRTDPESNLFRVGSIIYVGSGSGLVFEVLEESIRTTAKLYRARSVERLASSVFRQSDQGVGAFSNEYRYLVGQRVTPSAF
jgi:hypothetical protein